MKVSHDKCQNECHLMGVRVCVCVFTFFALFLALATIQQISQMYNSGLTPNRERKQTQSTINKVRRWHSRLSFPICF